MIKLNVVNEIKIENLPYEILEEVAKKILPKNINPHEITVAFRAILSLAQTNRKIYLLIQSNIIKNYVINVMEQNIQNLPRYVVKNFFRWEALSNRLDLSFLSRVLNEIQKIQSSIHFVVRKVQEMFFANNYLRGCRRPIQYEAHNFAHHQVGGGHST